VSIEEEIAMLELALQCLYEEKDKIDSAHSLCAANGIGVQEFERGGEYEVRVTRDDAVSICTSSRLSSALYGALVALGWGDEN